MSALIKSFLLLKILVPFSFQISMVCVKRTSTSAFMSLHFPHHIKKELYVLLRITCMVATSGLLLIYFGIPHLFQGSLGCVSVETNKEETLGRAEVNTWLLAQENNIF